MFNEQMKQILIETKETTPNDSEDQTFEEYTEDDEVAFLKQMHADPKTERN